MKLFRVVVIVVLLPGVGCGTEKSIPGGISPDVDVVGAADGCREFPDNYVALWDTGSSVHQCSFLLGVDDYACFVDSGAIQYKYHYANVADFVDEAAKTGLSRMVGATYTMNGMAYMIEKRAYDSRRRMVIREVLTPLNGRVAIREIYSLWDGDGRPIRGMTDFDYDDDHYCMAQTLEIHYNDTSREVRKTYEGGLGLQCESSVLTDVFDGEGNLFRSVTVWHGKPAQRYRRGDILSMTKVCKPPPGLDP